MPRTARTKTTTVKEVLPENVMESAPDLGALGDTYSDELETTLAQYDATGVRVQIFRVSRSGGEEYCFESATHVGPEEIRAHWGGGNYIIKIFGDGQFRKSLPLKIAEPLKQADSNNGNNNGTSTVDYQQLFITQMQASHDLAMAVIAGKGAQEQTSLKEVMEAVTGLQSVVAPPSPEDAVNKIMDLGLRIAEQTKSGATDWKSELISTVKDALPGLTATLPKRAASAQPVVPQEAQASQLVHTAIAKVKQFCMAGIMPPEQLVEWVLSNATDPQYQVILKKILESDFADFAALDPEIGQEPYVRYFSEIHSGLKRAYAENVQNADSSRADGDTANAPLHEVASKNE